MIVLGLTGSIAMGKSHVTRIFRALGVPVLDADREAHRLLEPGGAAVAAVLAAFGTVGNAQGGIDRAALGRIVFQDRSALARLEAIIHPAVREAERRFLVRQSLAKRPVAVLDIPLLLETGGARLVDRIAVVSAHPLIQRQRALARPGMTEERLAAILTKQMPMAEKRRRADYVIPSGHDRGLTMSAVRAVLADLASLRPAVWPSHWRHSRPEGAVS